MTHIQAAPAVAYALHTIATAPIHGTAPAFLTLAVLADRDLYSGNGYNTNTAGEVAEVLGADVDEIQEDLTALAFAGQLEIRDGDDTAFRVPQIAYDRSNGDAPVPGATT